MTALEQAKQRLFEGGFTAVLCRDGVYYTSTARGVLPLVKWVDSGVNFRGFSAADKVVGKATAFLYLLLGVSELYADVISEPARAVLSTGGVAVTFGKCVPYIINRNGDGMCPFEAAVLAISAPEAAKTAIRQKMREMKIGEK